MSRFGYGIAVGLVWLAVASTCESSSILLPLNCVQEAPAGSRFIDAARSTKGKLFEVEGPTFSYNPADGRLRISAPVLLGPADFFGSRNAYSVNSIELFHGGQLTDERAFPELVRYALPASSGLNAASVPESFTKQEASEFQQLIQFDENRILISRLNHGRLGALQAIGIEVDFKQFLLPSLDASLFKQEILSSSPLNRFGAGVVDPLSQLGSTLNTSISLQLSQIRARRTNSDEVTPRGISVILTYAPSVTPLFFSSQTTVLRATQRPVPEPCSFLLGMVALSCLATCRTTMRIG